MKNDQIDPRSPEAKSSRLYNLWLANAEDPKDVHLVAEAVDYEQVRRLHRFVAANCSQGGRRARLFELLIIDDSSPLRDKVLLGDTFTYPELADLVGVSQRQLALSYSLIKQLNPSDPTCWGIHVQGLHLRPMDPSGEVQLVDRTRVHPGPDGNANNHYVQDAEKAAAAEKAAKKAAAKARRLANLELGRKRRKANIEERKRNSLTPPAAKA